MFRTIHTSYGLAAMAQAEATGSAINLTHMAVGDGNGNPVTPSEGQTILVRERYRAAINRVYQNPDDSTRFTAEMIVPATEGGFVLREIGVYDAAGSLFAVGNLPDTYKPSASEGAFADTVIRLEFVVTNADVINIIIDPNTAVATQQWVLNAVTACTLFPGGTTGQVLAKKSNSCGDTEWINPEDVNVVIDLVEERQVLVANQTAVLWNIVTTDGLSVYVEGVRIPRGLTADEWTVDPANPGTGIILGKAYPAGTRIVGVQNEPLGSLAVPLYRDANLSDVLDKELARVNLDVFSRAQTREMAPPGLLGHFARSTAPNGWLKANGAAVSRTAYADLFAAIGTTFGGGDGFNTFNLPDLRGEFIRGWDDGRGADPGRGFGSYQTGTHVCGDDGNSLGIHGNGNLYQCNGDPNDGGLRTMVFQAPEVPLRSGLFGTPYWMMTRPRNRAMLACIKF